LGILDVPARYAPSGITADGVTTQSLLQAPDVSSVDAGGGAERYCFACGYNLRGLAGGRCPECGRPIERNEHEGLDAPWVRRSHGGSFDAFWHTAALVTFRPGDFARRFHWPRVRFHGSQVFRLWTVATAAGAIVIAALAVAWQFRVGWTGLAVLAGAVAPSAMLLMYGATELAGFFTGPRLPSDTSEEVFRARMVNDYASAALAWTPAPALLLLAGVAAGKLVDGPVDTSLYLLAAALAAWIGVLWVGDVLVMFGHALDVRTGVLVLAAVVFPIRFAGLVALTAMFIFAPLACAVGGLISLAR
jgi:hypothetical protein